PAELVVRVPVVLTRPEPDSERAPLLVRLTAPPLPADTVPVRLIAPVLFTVTLPPPAWLIPVTVRVIAVLVREMLPTVVLWAVMVAGKLVTALLPPSVVPPAELVVSRPPVIAPLPASAMVVPAVRLTAFAPAFSPALRVMAWVVVSDAVPPTISVAVLSVTA